uniref:Uncharacterized protein n=1 Tax=Fusarium oxysporum f. sp. physali TaxID=2212625 RepID=A0A7U0K8P8_FUSOX|nr:hypothetical protein [Fusarium oxysporum f. sp. physali]QQY97457.1 hypothetical protein [Fusarium oxysporum f. sp. physali]QQY97473.1 hypothetical protein [Fusarium oxysporum f. sp. physali]QQY97489.1 hypothetical protein [Fusarium oxysporum f. sp. physali]
MRSTAISRLLVFFAVFHTGLALSFPSFAPRGVSHWWRSGSGRTADNARPTVTYSLTSLLARTPDNIYRQGEAIHPNWDNQLHYAVTDTVQVFAWTYSFIEANGDITERQFVGVRNNGRRSRRVEVGHNTGVNFLPENDGTRIVYPDNQAGVASYEAWDFPRIGTTPVEIRLYD